MAAQKGYSEVLRVIAEYAPDSLSEKDDSGRTPAEIAARSGLVEPLRIIAELVPDSLTKKNRDGDAPLDWIQKPALKAEIQAINDRHK